MPNYIRSNNPGATYFFTVVSYLRRPVLTNSDVRVALRQAIAEVRCDRPFDVLAWVLLPDHLHCIWQLPDGDSDYSVRWSAIKRLTTQGSGQPRAASGTRASRRESLLWQRRFWEHQIRDDADMTKRIDYIHWNPVKHGLVKHVKDWPYSTFHRFQKNAQYSLNWGSEPSVMGKAFGE